MPLWDYQVIAMSPWGDYQVSAMPPWGDYQVSAMPLQMDCEGIALPLQRDYQVSTSLIRGVIRSVHGLFRGVIREHLCGIFRSVFRHSQCSTSSWTGLGQCSASLWRLVRSLQCLFVEIHEVSVVLLYGVLIGQCSLSFWRLSSVWHIFMGIIGSVLCIFRGNYGELSRDMFSTHLVLKEDKAISTFSQQLSNYGYNGTVLCAGKAV